MDRLAIVVPCYNEEEVLSLASGALRDVLEDLIHKGKIADDSFILFVNDGSKDRTWELIEKEHADYPARVKGVKLAGNVGHQFALTAGLIVAKDMSDVTISIDADLQDDVDVIEEMVDKFHGGCDIVYGVRRERKTDTFFKRFTAENFYKLMNAMGAEVVFNHADYRLISNRVLRELADFKEVNIFLRGMVPLVGFKSTSVPYERHERLAGKSHYPLSKMLALALDGITSLSIKPIKLIMSFGMVIAVISFIGIIWAIVSALLGLTVAGWASTVCIICFVSGIQLISTGVIGEYIGKIYLEVKARPRYIISERTGEDYKDKS